MITNNAPVGEQRTETSTDEAGTSLQNQVAIPDANNSIIQVLESSSTDWSSSDEDDGKQVVKTGPQHPNDNGLKITSTFADCAGVNSTVNNTSIYKDAVTVNNNFYCCPSSFDSVLEWCEKRRQTIFTTLSVLFILLIIILLGVWISNFIKSDQSNDVESEDNNSTVSSTEKISSSTTSITQITAESSSSTDITSSTTIISTTTDSLNISTTENPNHEWKIIIRKEWGAKPPNFNPKRLPYKIPFFAIISETETDGCNTTQRCMEIVRNLQATYLENYWKADIAYNFLVGDDGMAYEGRGWDFQAANEEYDTEYFNDKSIWISFIGKFDVDEPTPIILETAKTLLEFGVQTKKLSGFYKLLCFRQLSHTIQNPSDNLFKIIKMSEKWDSRTIDDFSPVEVPGENLVPDY